MQSADKNHNTQTNNNQQLVFDYASMSKTEQIAVLNELINSTDRKKIIENLRISRVYYGYCVRGYGSNGKPLRQQLVDDVYNAIIQLIKDKNELIEKVTT